MKVGDKVCVKKGYQYSCRDYSGRVGTIVRQNPFSDEEYGWLWYVNLDPTKRAKARQICIPGQQLELVI